MITLERLKEVRKWRKVKHGSSEDEILKERLCHYCALSFTPTRMAKGLFFTMPSALLAEAENFKPSRVP